MLPALGLAHCVPGQRLLLSRGLPVRGGAVPGRGATQVNRIESQPAGCSEHPGHEGEPGKQQLSRPIGTPVLQDPESVEFGAGPGDGEQGPLLRNVPGGRLGP